VTMKSAFRKIALIPGLLALATTVGASIDFTPAVNQYQSEGAQYSSVNFKDEKRSVSIILPRQWTCHGESSRLQMTPPKQSFAEGVLQSVPTKGSRRFDETTLKILEQQVVSTLPAGSQGVTMVSQQENTIMLGQNLSYEFVVSYKTLGQDFRRSVIFVNCPDQQLVFRFSAPTAAFENLNKAFRQSLCSWQWIDKPSTVVASQAPATAAN
jgi:hypothetical protein